MSPIVPATGALPHSPSTGRATRAPTPPSSSPSAKVTAPATAALASSTRPRDGVHCSVVRMVPLVNSAVIASRPSASTTYWVNSTESISTLPTVTIPGSSVGSSLVLSLAA